MADMGDLGCSVGCHHSCMCRAFIRLGRCEKRRKREEKEKETQRTLRVHMSIYSSSSLNQYLSISTSHISHLRFRPCTSGAGKATANTSTSDKQRRLLRSSHCIPRLNRLRLRLRHAVLSRLALHHFTEPPTSISTKQT